MTRKRGNTHNRRLRNREFARDSRLRTKLRISDLEKQVSDLSAEVQRLRLIAEIVNAFDNRHPMRKIGISIFKECMELLINPEITDDEIEEFMRESTEKAGLRSETRQNALRYAFQMTVNLMIPRSVLCCLAISEAQAVTETELAMEASLGPLSAAVFHQLMTSHIDQIESVRNALEAFKSTAGEFFEQVKLTMKEVVKVKKVLKPRQLMRHLIYVISKYRYLHPELILDYGRNCTEVLNRS